MIYLYQGVNVIEFGRGDIAISAGILRDSPHIGTISFCQVSRTNVIGTRDIFQKQTDLERGVHTRLVFTDMASIDVLIEQLQKAKRLAKRGDLLTGTFRTIVAFPLWIVGNALLKLSDYIR